MSDLDISRQGAVSVSDIHGGAAFGENEHMPDKSRKNFIETLRRQRGWSMQELAGRCVPPTTASQVNKLEKGVVNLTYDWMRRLSDALECHPADLIDGGPERLKPRTRAMVDIFEGLSEDQQDAWIKSASALARPPAAGKKKRGERAA
jgi:transcriptional regulator with XRE-family HTH domain